MPDFNTFLDVIKHWATHKANHPAFIFRSPQSPSHTQTFEQIYSHGGRYAAALKAGGAAQGHLVANTLPNCPERVICETAILMTGAASVSAMCQLADGSDLLRTLRVSRAMAVLVDPDVTHSPWHVLKNYVTLGDDDNAVSEELPHLKRVYFVRRMPDSEDDFLSKLDASSDWYMADDVGPDDVCTVLNTSGTSGFSKLVVHTHESVLQFIFPLLKDSVLFDLAPLGWIGGHISVSILLGVTRVLCDTKNGMPADLADFMLKCIKEEKVGYSFMPASHLNLLYQRVKEQKDAEGNLPDSEDPARQFQMLDFIAVGGQPITRFHVQTASQLARSVIIMYASTECVGIATWPVPDPDNYQNFDSGMVMKDVEVKVVKEENEDTILPTGKVGRILIKKPVMMKEYLHDPEANAAAFTHDGFFRTGDIGFVDERGHVIVGGRGSDAIMRGPYIFYPGWLEEHIRKFPGVGDALVVGIPDPDLNEEICACVVLKSNDVKVHDVQAFMEKEFLMSDDDPLSPRPRHYLAFDVFPVTPTGKPHRKVIKQQAAARLFTTSE